MTTIARNMQKRRNTGGKAPGRWNQWASAETIPAS
jgi:hypothetical protein